MQILILCMAVHDTSPRTAWNYELTLQILHRKKQTCLRSMAVILLKNVQRPNLKRLIIQPPLTSERPHLSWENLVSLPYVLKIMSFLYNSFHVLQKVPGSVVRHLFNAARISYISVVWVPVCKAKSNLNFACLTYPSVVSIEYRFLIGGTKVCVA